MAKVKEKVWIQLRVKVKNKLISANSHIFCSTYKFLSILVNSEPIRIDRVEIEEYKIEGEKKNYG
jgi:hypothetical protein